MSRAAENRTRKGRNRAFAALPCSLAGLILALSVSGCASTGGTGSPSNRKFNFVADTFAYPNQLVWEYYYDANGKWRSRRRQPPPQYWQHCFVVARSARQFFLNARFDPGEPQVSESTYRALIRAVVATSPRRARPENEKIVIPGYSDLRSFSIDREKLLKEECGGAWQSYVQRGHWRMIFPFSRHKEERVMRQLVSDLGKNQPLVVHLVRFPQLTINHAVVVFDRVEDEHEIRFAIYDPNNPEKPGTLIYNRTTRTFSLPANSYFPGGRVDVYEIYTGWLY